MKRSIFALTLVFCAAIIATSCGTGKPLLSTTSDNNDSYKIQYLFEHDGCKVYRFYDRGNHVYFTNCTGNVTAIANDSIKDRTQTITYGK